MASKNWSNQNMTTISARVIDILDLLVSSSSAAYLNPAWSWADYAREIQECLGLSLDMHVRLHHSSTLSAPSLRVYCTWWEERDIIFRVKHFLITQYSSYLFAAKTSSHTEFPLQRMPDRKSLREIWENLNRFSVENSLPIQQSEFLTVYYRKHWERICLDSFP